MNDKEMIAGLDACRPLSNDLRQPELRGVEERLANDPRADAIRVRLVHIDAGIMGAMHSAAIPDGLEHRLIARLKDAAGEAAMGDLAAADMPGTRTTVSPAQRDRPVSRRRWFAWSGGLAAAAAGLITLIVLHADKALTSDDLLMADRWHEVLAEANGWQPLEPDNMTSHPLPDELRNWPSRYRDASGAVGRPAMAYDISLPGGPRATLFIIEQAAWIQAPASAPQRPQSSTLGYSIAYWQRGETVYVVAIESDRTHEYQRLVRTVVPATA